MPTQTQEPQATRGRSRKAASAKAAAPEAVQEAPAPAVDLVQIVEPEVRDLKPKDAPPPPDIEYVPFAKNKDFLLVYGEADTENMRRSFVSELRKAHETPPAPAPQPVPPKIAEQTRLEMAVGRKRVQAAAEVEAKRVAIPRDPREGYSVEVFRPEDYIPSFNQGKTNPRQL